MTHHNLTITEMAKGAASPKGRNQVDTPLSSHSLESGIQRFNVGESPATIENARPNRHDGLLGSLGSFVSKQSHNADLELCDFLDLPINVTGEEHLIYAERYPFIAAMMKERPTRNAFLEKDGAAQINCTRSSQGWFRSIFLWRGRALDSIFGVWTVVLLHSTIYTLLMQFFFVARNSQQLFSWSNYFDVVINMTLGLLLVFRLNRAATRWWEARVLWGQTVITVRSLIGGILDHGRHCHEARYECLRWLAAFVLSSVEFLRGVEKLSPDMFAGILDKNQLFALENNRHPPLFAAQEIRHYLIQMFDVNDTEGSTAQVVGRVEQQLFLEGQLNKITDFIGGLERIKASPLPIVYVSHLRTFLLISVILFPYMWGPLLGWGTIPVSAITSFAMMGIESCAGEVETPFGKDRPNALNMDGFALGVTGNMVQMMRQHANREMWKLLAEQKVGVAQNNN